MQTKRTAYSFVCMAIKSLLFFLNCREDVGSIFQSHEQIISYSGGRAVARALIGGLNIHILMLCPIDFFSSQVDLNELVEHNTKI